MKNYRNYILSLITMCCVVISCGKSEKEVDPEDLTQIFSENLLIEGAMRVKGNIPVPTKGQYGIAIDLYEQNIETEPSNDFIIAFSKPRYPGIAFIKIEGSDEYFEIPFDNQSPTLNASVGAEILYESAKIKGGPYYYLNCSGKMSLEDKQRYDAKLKSLGGKVERINVQTYAPVPTKMGPVTRYDVDRSKMDDKVNWSPPQIFTINIKVSIPECKEVENEINKFLGLINTFQTNPTSASCNNLKASALKVLEEMKKCPKFKNDPNLQAAVDGWKGINCTGLD